MMKLFGSKEAKPPVPEPRRAVPAQPAKAVAAQAAPARAAPRPSQADPAARLPAPRPPVPQQRPSNLPARSEQRADDAELAPSGFGGDDDGEPSRRPSLGALVRKGGGASIVRLPPGDGVIRDPDEKLLAEIAKFSGKVVSASLVQKQRQYVALLEDGTLLLSKTEANSPTVQSARSLLQAEGHRHRRIVHVPLSVIREVYESYEKRAGAGAKGRDPNTANMQRLVLLLIRDAASIRCSDIHLDVKHHEAKIRVRSDGVMMDMRDLPSAQAHDLCQAAFNMADASDASYKPYEYQGARITSVKQALPDGIQAVRLQFNPLPDGGRHLVMRLLPSQKEGSNKDVDELGYSQIHVRQIRRMRDLPNGINIISGPTGSGKSTTLQRSLGATMREKRYEVSVITVEDPPEYEIAGAIQLPVTNVKTAEERSEAFRQAITASLRSDPDIVMIGEIRDAASASLAFQAAMTGHQVWGSLHANDAVSILGRLLDLGVEEWKLTDPSLITGLTGQRLVRRLCPECSLDWRTGTRDQLIDEETSSMICERIPGAEGLVRFARKGGCGSCTGRGYAGRSVVAETITPDQAFMDLIAEKKKPAAVRHWQTKLGGMTMLEHAVTKMLRGEVDPRDVKDKVGLIDTSDEERLLRFASEAAAGGA